MKKRRRAYKKWKPQHSFTLFFYSDNKSITGFLAYDEPDYSRAKNAIKRANGIPQWLALGVVVDDTGAHPMPMLKRRARELRNA